MQEIEYAKALFELASDNNQILEEFRSFNELLKIDGFEELLNIPSIKKSEKKKILDNVLKNFDELFIHFLYVLIDNNRMKDIAQIYNEYYKLVLKQNNYMLVDVYVNEQLKDDLLEQIKNKLKLKFNKNIELKMHINPNLIGGIRIEYDGNSVDDTMLYEFIKIKSLL